MKKEKNHNRFLCYSILLCLSLIATSCAHIRENSAQFTHYSQCPYTGFPLGNNCIANLEKTFDVFYLADNDSAPENQEAESLFQIVKYQKDNIQNRKIKIDGTLVNGKYLYSRKGKYYNNTVDYYECDRSDALFEFGINENTGNIDYYSWISLDYSQNHKNEEILSENECMEIAQKFLIKHGVNATKYQFITSNYRDIPEYKGLFTFEYSKVIDNICTSEKIFVNITVYGNIVGWNFVGKDTIEIESVNIRWDDNRIQNDVSIVLSTHTDRNGDVYDVSYELKDVLLSRGSDGHYYYIYSIETTKAAKNGKEKGYTDLINIAVLLDLE